MHRDAGRPGADGGHPLPPIQKQRPDDCIVALAGNPNVGKSTVFNALTGLHQHTGNWAGKTVSAAQGRYAYKGKGYIAADLPGTYSLLCASREEEVAADFILHGAPDCVVVVCDATCLERNLVLALQILELTDQVIVCVNLMDEAEKAGIRLVLPLLSRQLGVPVVGISAGHGQGLAALQEQVRSMIDGFSPTHSQPLITDQQLDGDARLEQLRGETPEQSDAIAARLVRQAEALAAQVVTGCTNNPQRRLDRILMGRGGIPVMLCLLLFLFWLTIAGANYPSAWLQAAFDLLGQWLRQSADRIGLPWYITGPLLDGVYATSARVVAVMLPPMAIFFPLFTLLEDFGYLPRVAFALDNAFRRCGACGKQALTLCMGFGCNAAGVVGCRIIDSLRDRLIAILTNALVSCNGQFPALILLITIFFSGSGAFSGLTAAAMLTGLVLLGVLATLGASKLLSKTVLRGLPSSFAMELPPYRRPQIGKVLVRSLLDRTAHVLGRAALVAAPAGLVIWVLANVDPGGVSLLARLAQFLDPLGTALGMNGVILVAFLLGFPANELVLPLAVMLMTASGVLADTADAAVGQLLQSGGRTHVTALCTMVFFLFHWPCSTTCLTIHRETGSWRWTALAMVLPTALGAALCALLRLLLG